LVSLPDFSLLFCSQAPEITAGLIAHAAVSQIIDSDISVYRQDESEDACK